MENLAHDQLELQVFLDRLYQHPYKWVFYKWFQVVEALSVVRRLEQEELDKEAARVKVAEIRDAYFKQKQHAEVELRDKRNKAFEKNFQGSHSNTQPISLAHWSISYGNPVLF